MRLDIADLSDHCPVISLQTLEVRLCQWPSLTGVEHCAPHTRAVHAVKCLEKEMAGRENFFQAVFKRAVVLSLQPPAAESMSPRQQKDATVPSLSGPTWTSLCGLPSKGRAVPYHCVHL